MRLTITLLTYGYVLFVAVGLAKPTCNPFTRMARRSSGVQHVAHGRCGDPLPRRDVSVAPRMARGRHRKSLSGTRR